MSLNRARVFLSVLIGILLIGGVGVALGVGSLLGSRDSARPPCEQLPDRESVENAVASHDDLATRIQNVGPGVKVETATPCEDQPDKAIIRIEYETNDEWEDINAILQQEDGFGAPVELVSS